MEQVQVDILQFADDALFVSEATHQNIFTVKTFIRCFELVSGLKVNFHKSCIKVLGIDRDMVHSFSLILNCNIMSIPFTYLCFPVWGNPRKKWFCEPLISKVKVKLSKWKEKHLSLFGRICLIKLVLTSKPLFILSFYEAHVLVCQRLTQI